MLAVSGRRATEEVAWHAMSDGNRRRILAVVRDEPRSVGEVAARLGMSQQIASHHLRVLHGAGLVLERRERQRHLFVVSTDGLAAVSDFLAGFWPAQLRSLKRAAESSARKPKGKRRSA
ncbi:MAG TPA: metalloregulator ArsR/SmtB family transcription factor [Candidatus Dormibacteraeota bacterium]|nr:metalloregulator ArsR/SmtB family transcription factor [Candidatus Dormibacteraeota bacterium]